MTNTVFLVGNVGADPDLRIANSGTDVASFSLGTSRPKRDSEGKTYKDASGFTAKDTEWHRVTCFNGLGRIIAQHGTKGMLVSVRGRLHYTRWTDREGIERYGCERWWKLDPELETTLREMGRRGDIVRTMNYALKVAMQSRAPQDQAIYDHEAPDARPVVGRLVASGLADEHADRRFLIVDGVDGQTHYVDVGANVLDARPGAIVQIEPRQAGVREVDRTIAAIAGASKGWYSVELHQFRDPTASEPFATAHLRRLEGLRRSGLPVEREVDGYWLIPPDHLERVEAHEQRLRARMPITVALLSGDRLDFLPERDGATWLDREIVAEKPVELGRGFGAEVRKAIGRRLQWLAAQRLIDLEGENYRFRSDLVDQLERRELRAAAAKIGRESGRVFREHEIGDHVQGICRGPVQVGDRKFALVEHSLEFSLVPWRPVLERQIGLEISGVVRGGGISWTIGRERQGPSIGM